MSHWPCQREMGMFGYVVRLKRLKDGESGFKRPCSNNFRFEVSNRVQEIGNCGCLSCDCLIQIHYESILFENLSFFAVLTILYILLFVSCSWR